ncbi:MAG: hypothetical protein WBN78_08665 [Gammaproteobacteria bacterium]
MSSPVVVAWLSVTGWIVSVFPTGALAAWRIDAVVIARQPYLRRAIAKLCSRMLEIELESLSAERIDDDTE